MVSNTDIRKNVEWEIVNRNINQWALELVSFEPSDINNTQVKILQDKIIDEYFGALLAIVQLDKFGVKKTDTDINGDQILYIPKIDRKLPVKKILKILSDYLGLKKDGSWYYRPVVNGENKDFIGVINWKLIKVYEDYKKNAFNINRLGNPRRY